MPKKAGDQLLAEVRANEAMRDVLFLMLTARSDKQSVSSALRAGVNGYIVKPYDNQNLIDKIQQLLDERNAGDLKTADEGGADAGSVSNDGPEVAEKEQNSKGGIVGEIVRRLETGDIKFPVLSDVYQRVEQELKADNVEIASLVKVIETDPVITSSLIGVANSAYYRGTDPVKTLSQAISRLGLETTKNNVLMIHNRNMFHADSPLFEEIVGHLWEHSLATAGCARITAAKLGRTNLDDIYTMGLLHDIGKLLLLQILMELEKARDGIDQALIFETLDKLHTKFGIALLTNWKLSDEYKQIVQFHLDLSEAENLTKELLIINFANKLVGKMGYDIHGAEDIDLGSLQSTKLLDLDQEKIDAIMAEVKEYVDEVKGKK